MNTALTITLIVALVIASVLDIIRIVQYKATNKAHRPRAIREIVHKVLELKEVYDDLRYRNLYTDGLTFVEWCVEHWDYDKKK